MSQALRDALKKKFGTPAAAIAALGLDAELLEKEDKAEDEEEDDKKKADDADDPENFLKSKMSEDDFSEYKKMCDAKAKDAEMPDAPEDKGKKPPMGSWKASDKKGRDAEPDDKKDNAEDDDDPRAMDERIQDRVNSAVAKERQRIMGVSEAERFVKPWVGELAFAMDSAEDVYKKALSMQGVKGLDKIHPSAYRALLEAQPKPGARRREAGASHATTMGMDSSNREAASKYAPGLERIRIGA